MPFSFGKKDNEASIQPLDDDGLQEVKKIHEMLNPNEEVLVVARQSRIKPGGSAVTPNIIFATNKRIIIKDPYMMGIKENIVDIPYDVVTSVKLEKGLLSSTIRFEAPALIGSKKLGMIDGIVSGENDHQGVIEAITHTYWNKGLTGGRLVSVDEHYLQMITVLIFSILNGRP